MSVALNTKHLSSFISEEEYAAIYPQVEAAHKQLEAKNGNKNVTIKVYPKLNHLFQTCEKGTLAEYGQLEETINPEVLKDMTEWIKKQQ